MMSPNIVLIVADQLHHRHLGCMGNKVVQTPHIDRLATAGVTKGCNPAQGNTKFCPHDCVTRGQMAAFLHRALG